LRDPDRGHPVRDPAPRRLADDRARPDALPRRVRVGEPAHRGDRGRDAADPPRGAPDRADERAAAGPDGDGAGGDRLMAALLELRQLSKAFGGLQVISELDLHVGEGEIVSVIGPNGAGKTTLFNLITGIFRPDSGDIGFD